MNRATPTVIILLVANGLLFLAAEFQESLEDRLALFYPQNDNFRIWQFLSYMFMHGGVGHIFFNMFALFSFGTPLEILWGRRRFITFFLICGVGAGLIYTGINYFQFESLYSRLISQGVSSNELQIFMETGRATINLLSTIPKEELLEIRQIFGGRVVGASGAVYGILVAFALLFPNAKLALIFLPVPVSAKYFVPVLLALDLFSGITGFSLFGGGIAHFAHIGGALIGFSLMWYWKKTNKVAHRANYFSREE